MDVWGMFARMCWNDKGGDGKPHKSLKQSYTLKPLKFLDA